MGMISGLKIHCITCMTCALVENRPILNFHYYITFKNIFLSFLVSNKFLTFLLRIELPLVTMLESSCNFLVCIKNHSVSSLWNHYRGLKSPRQ